MSATQDRVVAWQRNELLFAAFSRLFGLVRRFWFITLPIAAALVFGFIGFVLVGSACGYLFKRQRDALAAAVQALYDDAGGEANYHEMQRLASMWPAIARSCGLDQRAQASPLGIRGAASRQLNAVEHSLAQAAYGGQESVVPSIDTICASRLGFRLEVVMLDGQTIDNYRKAAESLANCFEVEEVRISQDRPKVACITPVTSDPLGPVVELTPDTLMPAKDLDSVPMGMAEDGTVWHGLLDQVSEVVGGNPGGGKSVYINVKLANLASRDDFQVIGIDLKGGLEMGDWEGRSAASAYDQQTAAEVLAQLVELHNARMPYVRQAGKAKLTALGYSADHPLVLVVIDEAAELFSPQSSDKEAKALAAECMSAVSLLIRLGRATGIFVLLATQRPGADVIPTLLRDTCQQKTAFRTTTPEQSRMILGDLASAADYSPTQIKMTQPGVAVTVTDKGVTQRVRSFYISEESRREVVQRTAHLTRSLPDLIRIAKAATRPYWNEDDPDDGPDLDLALRRPSGPSLPPGVTGCQFGFNEEAS
jgi:hypothetical protein